MAANFATNVRKSAEKRHKSDIPAPSFPAQHLCNQSVRRKIQSHPPFLGAHAKGHSPKFRSIHAGSGRFFDYTLALVKS